MKTTKKTNILVKAALIGAVYCILSLILKPLSYGPLQIRISEALCMLVLFTKAAPWGLFVGCLITNIISPYGLLDVVLGSLATLLASLIALKFKNRYAVAFPFVLVNAFIIAFVICLQTNAMSIYFQTALYLALSEALSVYVIGVPLTYIIEKNEKLYSMIADPKE